MEVVVGIFDSHGALAQAANALEHLGVRTSSYAPQNHRTIPADDGEQPGMSAAIGAATGMGVGIAGASLLVPGVGPIMVAGLAAGALLGAGSGAAVGHRFEASLTEGVPRDEVFVYEDALRKGRSVLLAFVDDGNLEQVRLTMRQSGAESVDAAREQWWIGLRSAEQEHYPVSDDEEAYRRGFEAALHLDARGVPFDARITQLKTLSPTLNASPAFRAGYEHGQEHVASLSRNQHSPM